MRKTDNDMDELFREAAEGFPLKISGQNWDKVLAALDAKDNYPSKKPNKRRWWWSSLLLLLVPFICTRIQERYHEQSSTKLLSVKGYITVTESSVAPDNNYASATTIMTQNNNLLLPASILKRSYKKYNYDHLFTETQSNGSLVKSNVLQWQQSAKVNIAIETADIGQDVDDAKKVDPFEKPEMDSIQNVPREQKTKEEGLDDNTIEKKLNPKKQQKKTDKNQKSSNNKFYVSLLGGASTSRVKGEGFQPMGITAGISVGYNISKRIAVEAGAFYAQKKYNTAFQYFDNSKTQWPSIRIIKKVEGECTLIELPVSVRYNFKPVRKHSYFASAGLSSYIMKKEDYEYNYTTPGNMMERNMYKSYYNSSRDWFSVLQLSVGWQHTLSKKIDLRAQPFYNLPIGGVGLGKLPVSGLGAVAGITISLK